MKREINWSYLAAFIDGEGHIASPLSTHRGDITLVNTNKELLLKIQMFLTTKRIKSNLYERNTKSKLYHKGSYDLIIRGYNNLIKIYKYCPMQDNDKINRLKIGIISKSKRLEHRQKIISEFLDIKQKHPDYSLRKIARMLNRDLSNLYRWNLRNYLQRVGNSRNFIVFKNQ